MEACKEYQWNQQVTENQMVDNMLPEDSESPLLCYHVCPVWCVCASVRVCECTCVCVSVSVCVYVCVPQLIGFVRANSADRQPPNDGLFLDLRHHTGALWDSVYVCFCVWKGSRLPKMVSKAYSAYCMQAEGFLNQDAE